MAKKKEVSMQNLADKLGISKVTVSKALNGKDGVSQELREKILQTAQEHGYTLPDYGERRTKKIGIIMSNRFGLGNEGEFYMRMYEKIINELRNYSCSSIMMTPDRKSLASDLRTINEMNIFDGLIFLGILDKDVRKKMDAIELPKIYVDIYDRTNKSDSVVTENIYSSYELTKHLIHMGHNDIGFVGTVGGTTSIMDRYLGYARGMMEKGLEIQEKWMLPDRDEDGNAVQIQLPKELPTAFVCNCDETAFRLVKELENRGLHVPQDVSVVGFDDSIYAKMCSIPLTTVAVDTDEIGRITAKQMAKQVKNSKGKRGKVFRVMGNIVFRDSVRDLREVKTDI